jgi:hypothetical protein
MKFYSDRTAFRRVLFACDCDLVASGLHHRKLDYVKCSPQGFKASKSMAIDISGHNLLVSIFPNRKPPEFLKTIEKGLTIGKNWGFDKVSLYCEHSIHKAGAKSSPAND